MGRSGRISLRAAVRARGTIRATRRGCGLRRRRRRLHGRLGSGGFRFRRDGRQRRTARRKGACRPRRAEIGTQRNEACRQYGADEQKVLQDQHRSAKSFKSRRGRRLVPRGHLSFNRGPVWRYQGRGPGLDVRKARKMKTRAGLLPAGPCRPQPHPRRYIRGRQLGRERQPSYRRSS